VVTSHAVLDLGSETLAVTALSMPNLEAEALTMFNFLALRLKDGYALLKKQAHRHDNSLGLPTLDSRTQISLFNIIVRLENERHLVQSAFCRLVSQNNIRCTCH